MKKILIAVCLIVLSLQASARRYYTGIGLRADRFGFGATFKHFYNTDNATGLQFDGFYGIYGSYGFVLKGYYIKQIPFKIPIIQLPLDLVIGPGLHIAYFPAAVDNGYHSVNSGQANYYSRDGGAHKSVIAAGVDATIQIEYRIPIKKVPFTIGFDFNPFYEFYNRGPEWLDFGLCVRYVFI